MPLLSTFRTPCGTKNHYPEKLDYLTRQGSFCVFHTYSTKDRKAYLVMPKNKGIEFIAEGTLEEIIHLYESLELDEISVVDSNGVFFYKQADNFEVLDKEIKKFLSNEI